MTMDTLKTFSSFAEACAAFKDLNPQIFINHNPDVAEEVQLANAIAKELRDAGLDAVSLNEFQNEHLLPGQDWELEYQRRAEQTTHMINLPSAIRSVGQHNVLKKILMVKTDAMDDGETCLFDIGLDRKLWSSETEKIKLIARMIDFRAEEEVKVRSVEKIDWSDQKFAHLLGRGATIQDLSDVAPGLETGGRFSKVIIVQGNEPGLHNFSSFDDAITFSADSTHDEKTAEVAIQCHCGRCGDQKGKRHHFAVDKSKLETHGVLIVENIPCSSCNSIVGINPASGFTLEKALDEIHAG